MRSAHLGIMNRPARLWPGSCSKLLSVNRILLAAAIRYHSLMSIVIAEQASTWSRILDWTLPVLTLALGAITNHLLGSQSRHRAPKTLYTTRSLA
jgi:hypothetical protein